MTPMPTRRPQAAPIKSEGIKTPLDTLRPYVQHAIKKYKLTNIAKLLNVKDPEKKKTDVGIGKQFKMAPAWRPFKLKKSVP